MNALFYNQNLSQTEINYRLNILPSIVFGHPQFLLRSFLRWTVGAHANPYNVIERLTFIMGISTESTVGDISSTGRKIPTSTGAP